MNLAYILKMIDTDDYDLLVKDKAGNPLIVTDDKNVVTRLFGKNRIDSFYPDDKSENYVLVLS